MDSFAKDSSLHELANALNSGSELQTVDPAELKNAWDIVRKVQRDRPGQQVAIGIDFIAASRVSSDPTPANIMAVMLRATVLNALFDRGVLKEFESDGGVNDVVFRAAATMAVDANDLAAATMQMNLAKLSADEEKQFDRLQGLSIIEAKFRAAARQST